MSKEKDKGESANEWKILKEASKEVESWPNWMQKNAELLFEENINQAAREVAIWPAQKIQNMKAVFSEPDINVPKDIQNPNKRKSNV